MAGQVDAGSKDQPGATGAIAGLTTPTVALTEPMHSYKTATARPSVAHEATGLSTAAGNGASCHSPVLLKQRNHVSDSPGIAFGGVELMSELNEIATAPQKPKWLRVCC